MLQIQTIEPGCLALLRELMAIEELKTFRLAGGTGLSLRLGHRISIDIDLFTNQIFDIAEFTTFLKIYFKDRILINGTGRYGVFAAIDNIKVDFVYRHEKFIRNEDIFDGVRIASLEDIGAMKILAAANRYSRKDYYDLYELLSVFSFTELIEFYSKIYSNHDIAGTLKSISNFNDEPMDCPILFKETNWEVVITRFSDEIRNYILILRQKGLDAEDERNRNIAKLIQKKKNKN